MSAAGRAPAGAIRVGIGGWTFAPWRDNFYPKGLVQRRELEYASRHLTAIEVNGTYYGTQKPATYARWRDEVPEGFVFSAKAPKRIVQARGLSRTGAQVEDFVGGIATLGDRLGPLVWQFDRGVRIDRDEFEAFLALLPRQADGIALRHVLDVRDPGFVGPGYLDLARRRRPPRRVRVLHRRGQGAQPRGRDGTAGRTRSVAPAGDAPVRSGMA